MPKPGEQRERHPGRRCPRRSGSSARRRSRIDRASSRPSTRPRCRRGRLLRGAHGGRDRAARGTRRAGSTGAVPAASRWPPFARVHDDVRRRRPHVDAGLATVLRSSPRSIRYRREIPDLDAAGGHRAHAGRNQAPLARCRRPDRHTVRGRPLARSGRSAREPALAVRARRRSRATRSCSWQVPAATGR